MNGSEKKIYLINQEAGKETDVAYGRQKPDNQIAHLAGCVSGIICCAAGTNGLFAAVAR